jgi:hypothetical protein
MVAKIAAANSRPMTDQAFMTEFSYGGGIGGTRRVSRAFPKVLVYRHGCVVVRNIP